MAAKKNKPSKALSEDFWKEMEEIDKREKEALAKCPLVAIVCGGRDFKDQDFVWEKLFEIVSSRTNLVSKLARIYNCKIVDGDADGVDTLAWSWAKRFAKWRETVSPDYSQYGRGAPLVRNQQMIDLHNPNLVIAFPGGTGTNDMVKRARFAGIEVVEVEYK